MKKKEYEVPADIESIMDKVKAAEDMRNIYIERPRGFRKAYMCGADIYKYHRLFWRKIRELYPELRGKKVIYNSQTGKITLDEGK